MIQKIFSCLLFLTVLLFNGLPSFAQQIITDGRTQTNLAVNGNVTNVTTNTFYGNNAINSFSKFNVDSGNVVNLHEPAKAARLVNLIKDQRSDINGILNGIKNGHIGGNIYFINPYGMVVGSQGAINVGSLTVITPQPSEINYFFNPNKTVNPIVFNKLINNKAGINPNAQVTNNGTINTKTNVAINTGTLNNYGKITTAAIFKENNIELGDVVNINGAETPATMVKTNGTIIIGATNEINNYGQLLTDGGYRISGGSITLNSKDINLNQGSEISSKGKGYSSSGGSVQLLASNINTDSTIIDTSGGQTGHGGLINLTAKNNTNIKDTIFKPSATKGSFNKINIKSFNINANGNIKTNGSELNITATNKINFTGNTEISTRIANVEGISMANSGNLYLSTPSLAFSQGQTVIDTSANNSFNSGMIKILSNQISNQNGLKQIINSGKAQIFLNRLTIGDININDGNNYNSLTNETTGDPGMFASKNNFDLSAQKVFYGITAFTDLKTTQNVNINLDLNTVNNLSIGGAKKVYLNKDISAKNIEIIGNTGITGPGKLTASENISLRSVNGQIGAANQYLKIDEGPNGNLTTYSKLSTWLYEMNGDIRLNEINSANDIYLLSNGNIVNARATRGYNVIANNLYVIKKVNVSYNNGNYYMFGIDTDPFNNNVQSSVFDIYKEMFRSNGQNWASMPEENFKLFDQDKASFTKNDVLSNLKQFADKTTNKDLLFVMYEGHGGSMTGSDSDPNKYKSYMEYGISDQEFANALSNSKGTVVFVTGQCYGGGMFGGNTDIDQVATRNGFKFFGMSGTDETHYAWATPYAKAGGSYTGFVHLNLLNSATQSSSYFYNYLPTQKMYEVYKNDYAFNSDGNLYLNEWHSAINKRDTFYVPYNNSVYPYAYKKFTNMGVSDFMNTPIVIRNWDSSGVDNSIITNNIGSSTNPLQVYIKGSIKADISGTSNVSGIVGRSRLNNASVTNSSNNTLAIPKANANSANIRNNSIINSEIVNVKVPNVTNGFNTVNLRNSVINNSTINTPVNYNLTGIGYKIYQNKNDTEIIQQKPDKYLFNY